MRKQTRAWQYCTIWFLQTENETVQSQWVQLLNFTENFVTRPLLEREDPAIELICDHRYQEWLSIGAKQRHRRQVLPITAICELCKKPETAIVKLPARPPKQVVTRQRSLPCDSGVQCVTLIDRWQCCTCLDLYNKCLGHHQWCAMGCHKWLTAAPERESRQFTCGFSPLERMSKLVE